MSTNNNIGDTVLNDIFSKGARNINVIQDQLLCFNLKWSKSTSIKYNKIFLGKFYLFHQVSFQSRHKCGSWYKSYWNSLLTPFRAQNPRKGRKSWCNSSIVGGRPCLRTWSASSAQPYSKSHNAFTYHVLKEGYSNFIITCYVWINFSFFRINSRVEKILTRFSL